jgi:hypothetical protein
METALRREQMGTEGRHGRIIRSRGGKAFPGERELSSYFQNPVYNLFKERKGKLFEDSSFRNDIEKAASRTLAGDQEFDCYMKMKY